VTDSNNLLKLKRVGVRRPNLLFVGSQKPQLTQCIKSNCQMIYRTV